MKDEKYSISDDDKKRMDQIIDDIKKDINDPNKFRFKEHEVNYRVGANQPFELKEDNKYDE